MMYAHTKANVSFHRIEKAAQPSPKYTTGFSRRLFKSGANDCYASGLFNNFLAASTVALTTNKDLFSMPSCAIAARTSSISSRSHRNPNHKTFFPVFWLGLRPAPGRFPPCCFFIFEKWACAPCVNQLQSNRSTRLPY